MTQNTNNYKTYVEQQLRKDNRWVEDEEYSKAIGQFRLQLNGILEPLRLYGQQPFVDQATEEIVKLAEDFGLRIRGIDHPIMLKAMRSKIHRSGIDL